jgi:DNA invertase Pin-like site-specific DNA recombinase
VRIAEVSMAEVGYVRVSTADQSLDLQLQAMEKEGIAKVFKDHGVSGTLASRPALDEALAYVREGDVFTVWKLDRLGRSTKNVLEVIDRLNEAGVGFRSLTEGLDTTGPMGKAMLTVLAAFNQLERDVIVERTKAGLDAARAKGRVGGRPRVMDAKKINTARALYESGNHTVAEIASMMGVGTATVYRYLAAGRTAS